MSELWNCSYCSHALEERPRNSCPRCGLVQEGEHTHQKYEILKDYLPPLSLIMRNRGYKHCFVDACAGSGIVQRWKDNQLGDGSPLIMTNTREEVENKIKDKTKKPSVECRFVEYNPKTFKVLKETLHPYRNFAKCTKGDCNTELDGILDEFSRCFVFVYIDPFGLGEPVIEQETVEKVLDRKFTELFIHFSWEGVMRSAGQLKNIDHHDSEIKKKALSTVKTLDRYLGAKWRDIWPDKADRQKRILELYLSKLRVHYKHIEHIEIPFGSKYPRYYLVFTSRNETGAKIMKHIIDTKRRRGTSSLNDYME